MATTGIARFYESNALSFLGIAAYWVKEKVWDRAIAALRAAIRSATRAGRADVAGEAFYAIRQCQDAARIDAARLDAPNELRETVAAAGRQ